MQEIEWMDLQNRIQSELNKRRSSVHELQQQIIAAEREVDFMVKVFDLFMEHRNLVLTTQFVTCDGTRYFLQAGKHTGRGLRNVFDVGIDHDLWGTRDKDDALMQCDDAQIDVEAGARFYTTSKKING